jgi:hypothetical protein
MVQRGGQHRHADPAQSARVFEQLVEHYLDVICSASAAS